MSRLMIAGSALPRFVAQRVLQMIPLLLIVVTVLFILIQLAPGDPVRAMTGDFPLTPEYRAAIVEQYGLDRPMWERYWIYLMDLARGDLGYSLFKRESVTSVLLARIGPTALLTGAALVGAAVLGVLSGVIAGRRPHTAVDNGLSVFAVMGYSIPVFWLAQLLLLFFAVKLSWFPAQGMNTLGQTGNFFERLPDTAAHLVLPAAALSVRFFVVDMRMTRTSLIEAFQRNYITMARSKGQSETRILTRHALPNSLLPVITIIGVDTGALLTGSALVEVVFGWPGLGSLLLESTNNRDYPMLMGIFLLMACAAIFANLVTDVLYAYIDPRIRY